MKTNKKGFTILEMIIVLLIISVLLLSLKNIFFPKNKDIIYGKICANNIYGIINNYLNNAITGKGVYTGNNFHYPDVYNIAINTTKNSLKLGFEKNNTNYNYSNFILSGDKFPNYYCNTNSYIVKFSGNNTNLKFAKGLNSQKQNFSIYQGTEKLTGNIYLFLCPTLSPNKCYELGIINFDKRSQFIKLKTCLAYNSNNIFKCKERE